MDKNEMTSMLKTSPLFWNIDKNQLKSILSQSEEITYEEGDVIVHEGELSEDVYLIVSGTAKVIQKTRGMGISVLLTVLEPGEIIGELALIDSYPRSATIVANKGLKVLKLPFKKTDFEKNTEEYIKIIINLSKITSSKLRHFNEIVIKTVNSELHQEKYHNKVGNYFILIMVFVSVWSLSLLYTTQPTRESVVHLMLSWSIILGSIVGTLQHMKSHDISYSFYGFSLYKWRNKIRDAVVYTIPLLLWLIGMKVLCVHYLPQYSNINQLSRFFEAGEISNFWMMLFPLLYIGSIPFIEIILRGVMQSSLKSMLKLKGMLWPIFIPNLLFSIIEANISLIFPLITFIPSCLIGWIREEQDTLLGGIIAHLLTAICFFILFWN